MVTPGNITFPDKPPKITHPLSYPQQLKKKMIDEQFSKFLNIFNKLHVNIPFADALEQMSHYAKFMKEIMTKKKKIEEQGTINQSEQCSAIIQRKLPEKLKDPRSFTIPCSIGGHTIEKALCDLGASINLMPSSILNKLDIGDLTPTLISLQMADRSFAFPRGILEDILVKIAKFIFPVNFVILDIEDDREVSIILGRPFSATGHALIDVREGNLTLQVNGEEVKFNIPQAMKFPSEEPSCKRIKVLRPQIENYFHEPSHIDPL